MSVKELLKQNAFFRKIGKRINNIDKFRYEEKEFYKYYLDSAERNNNYKYTLMLLIHNIEKGLCMNNPRPFGFAKVTKIMECLNKTDDKESFEYNLGVSILFEWCKFYESNNWEKNDVFNNVKEFLKDKKQTYDCGRKIYKPYEFEKNTYKDIVLSRSSVRDYKDKKIEVEDISDAIKSFIATPTACNRQMCKLIKVEDESIKNELNNIVLGTPGLNKDLINYFIITYDIASLSYSGEAQQGLFNAGLCTTNFINALHSLNIGSCCLQWSNKPSQDIKMRKILNLKPSERIAIVIAAGYYLDENIVPYSVRKDVNDYFEVK